MSDIKSLVELWLFEYAVSHRMMNIVHECCCKYNTVDVHIPSLSMRLGVCMIDYALSNDDIENYPLAIDTCDWLYESNSHYILMKHYSKLSAGLKTLTLFDMLRREDKMILPKLNQFFPRSGFYHKNADPEFTKVMCLVQKNFRRFFLRLISNSENQKIFMEKDFYNEFGDVFVNKLKFLARDFVVKIDSTLPPTHIDQIIISNTTNPKIIEKLSSKDEIAFEILLEVIENKQSLNECDIREIISMLNDSSSEVVHINILKSLTPNVSEVNHQTCNISKVFQDDSPVQFIPPSVAKTYVKNKNVLNSKRKSLSLKQTNESKVYNLSSSDSEQENIRGNTKNNQCNENNESSENSSNNSSNNSPQCDKSDQVDKEVPCCTSPMSSTYIHSVNMESPKEQIILKEPEIRLTRLNLDNIQNINSIIKKKKRILKVGKKYSSKIKLTHQERRKSALEDLKRQRYNKALSNIASKSDNDNMDADSSNDDMATDSSSHSDRSSSELIIKTRAIKLKESPTIALRNRIIVFDEKKIEKTTYSPRKGSPFLSTNSRKKSPFLSTNSPRKKSPFLSTNSPRQKSPYLTTNRKYSKQNSTPSDKFNESIDKPEKVGVNTSRLSDKFYECTSTLADSDMWETASESS